MVDISDLSCTGKNGKQIHGTAAVLHRLFGKGTEYDDYDRAAEMKELEKIIHDCGYMPSK